MSIQGLAAFGLGLAGGYQQQTEKNKLEAEKKKLETERLEDKQYQRGREKVQDDRAAAADGRAVETFKIQKEASQMTLDAEKLKTQIEGGLRRASLAYSTGDKSGAFAAFEETGNSLYPDMQMKFDRDDKGNIIVDPTTGAASGQRFTATGAPIGQKISMKPEQAHQTLYAAMNPTKYVENQAAAAAEVAKADREWQLHQRKGLFDARLGVVTHGEKKRIDSQYGQQDKLFDYELDVGKLGIQHVYGVERDALKPTTGGAANQQLVPALGGGVSALPSSLIRTESGGNFGASNTARGHGGAIGHFGRAQFGQARLQEAKAAGAIPKDMTPEQFKASPEAQASAEQWHQNDIVNFINKNGFDGKVGTEIKGVPVTLNGLVAVAHLGGKGGMQKFIQTNGRYDPADANGTRLSDYLRTHGQAEISGRIDQNTAGANAIANNVDIVAKQLATDLKGGEGGVQPIVLKESLAKAGGSLSKMIQQRHNPDNLNKNFNAAATHVTMMLTDSGVTNPSNEMVWSIMAKMLGMPSSQAMINELFNAKGRTAKPAQSSKAAKTTANPFEGSGGIQAATPATQKPAASANLYPDTTNLTDAQRAAVTKNMFAIGSDQ